MCFVSVCCTLSEVAPCCTHIWKKKIGCEEGSRWWSVWGSKGRGPEWWSAEWREGWGVMSVCSQCKWHLSSSDRFSLSLPVMGTPSRTFSLIYPPTTPPTTHTHTITLTISFSPSTDNSSCLFIFSARIFHKLLPSRCLWVQPFFCIIFNQSSPLSETADFL